MLPSLQSFYDINYITVSLVFFSPLIGYISSGILNTRLHKALGQRGLGVLCGGTHMLSAIINVLHPPFPVIVVSFMLGGLGNGLSDAAWNAWIGNLDQSNELLGFLHAAYGVGGIASPLIATAIITRAALTWYTFYYFVVSLGGWVVEFLLHVRKGEAFASGMGATGYWLGITLGRILLPFVTNLIGLKMAVTVYLAAAMAAELVFWLAPNFYASIVAVGLQGFFIGPMFPHAMSAVTSLLPPHLHVVVIGFVAALGGCGASLLPFAVGMLAQRFSVTALQPFILASLGLSLAIWLFMPHAKKGNAFF
ncbi:hypothetical protein CTA1_7695 [Colletotrichum tanaceti]|uniref:Major facilitator superfamily (MFS) profile domain-containing protein n=1 Tax=Colletotrichum tanaceti TaxID=1306861 RepID=A0A4U6XB21_9PEZI|nr:hypothetical protein CTA1_7695 [Colletotrichum tanaceti]